MSSQTQYGHREARRAAFAADAASRTGIDENMIKTLVHGFYARVRADSVLAPVFASRIANWDGHLERMCAFWSPVVLMSGRYHGQPMQKHNPLPVGAHHFDRWLELFKETARDLCPSAAAKLFIEKASLIAQSLELGIGVHRGLMLGEGERLPEAGHV